MSETRIYLDNAATTAVSDNVFEAMMPWLKEGYGNASSLYSLGRKSAIALNKARARCAELLGCESSEIIFTSGGSESNNQVLFSAARSARAIGKDHIITSAIEHHSVLEPLRELERQGFRITRLPVGENGIVEVSDVEREICDDTALVTVMAVNNEIGTIQPIAEIGKICAEHGVLFHTDAVQAFGELDINVREMNIDMMSISGHKLHAMKGVGLLYAKKSAHLHPFILGGAQQGGKRAGTECIAGIVGLAEAMSNAAEIRRERKEKLIPLRERIIDEVLKISGARLNGDREKRVSSIVNFSFNGVEGEALVLQLDLKGIAVSSGSACASGSLEPSHVLKALGLSHAEAGGSMRVSMSELTTRNDIYTLLVELPPIIEKLRGLR